MTSTKDSGGSAFPIPQTGRSGMTLRDYFAGQAISEIISFCANDTRMKNESAPEAFARKSYEIADAMIEARK